VIKLKKKMNLIKWLCFAIMLAGAIVVSFNLDPILGIELLFVGNAAWLATAIRSRDWPSAANFGMLASVWFLGIVQYYKDNL
jgi:drug/metabolite transporter (DMT)-like permease